MSCHFHSQIARVVFCLFMAIVLISPTQGQQTFEPTEASLAKHAAAPEWFRDAKLGIYFHWGPYTVAAHGNEWYPRWMHFDFDDSVWDGRKKGYHIDLLKWHTNKFGHPSEFGYHDLIPLFTGEHFDAEQWADLFQQSGAKFAGPVAMHHDGFALWDSQITPWNSKAKGPKKDITGELASAIRKRSMKLITTFHHSRHLQRYKGQTPQQAMQRYGHLDSYHAYWNSHYPWIEGLATSSEDPELRILYGNLPEEQWLEEFWLGCLKEVTDKYHPDIVWFDTWLDLIPASKRYGFAAYYFNQAQKNGQSVMLTHKHQDMPPSFSVEDLEKGRRVGIEGAAWMTDDTLSTGSWSYVEGMKIKPTKRVLHDFIDTVSKNGQLLLNVSPRADGSIPDDQRKVLTELGSWLKTNGNSIYGTRPWTIYGEGPNHLTKGGHFSAAINYNANDIRFTTKGKTIYAISLGTPTAPVKIVALARNNSLLGQRVFQSVKTLNGDFIESWVQDTDGLKITLRSDAPKQIAYAFEIN